MLRFLELLCCLKKSYNENVQIVTFKLDDKDHIFEFVIWFNVEHSKWMGMTQNNQSCLSYAAFELLMMSSLNELTKKLEYPMAQSMYHDIKQTHQFPGGLNCD